MRARLALAVLGALAACAYRPEPIPDGLPALDRLLALEYDRLAAEEFDERDWADGRLFAQKAEAARAGETPLPDDLSTRALPEAVRTALGADLERLRAALESSARLVAPEALARAQGAFDCLAQESEEGRQPDEITVCRDAFDASLATAEAAATEAIVVLLEPDEDTAVVVERAGDQVVLDQAFEGATSGEDAPAEAATFDQADVLREIDTALTAEPRPQRSYFVNFETGETTITEASEAAFAEALADIEQTEAVEVTVFGHTDRQGSDRVNTRIARERAELVRQLLLDAGLPPETVEADSFGERFPLVETEDGVAEPLNRRVEIVVR